MMRDVSSFIKKTPVILLTGFLGSGKTTLLREVLAQDAWKDTAVLVNELGTVGLDHKLMWNAGGSTVVLENGCICCSIRDDLVSALEDLFWERLRRQIPAFSRVVIETTGLADPWPIIETLLSSGLVSQRYRLTTVLCTVDATIGDAQLEHHSESLAQAACADTIILTKTDLVTTRDVDALESKLRTINPLAIFQRAAKGSISAEPLQLLAHGERSLTEFSTARRSAPHLREHQRAESRSDSRPGAQYHERVNTVALHFIRPWQIDSLEHALEATLARYGDRILRLKGLIDIENEERPMVVQAVQKRMFPNERLDSWPEGKRSSFIVCISLGLPAKKIAQEFRSHLEPAAFPVTPTRLRSGLRPQKTGVAGAGHEAKGNRSFPVEPN